MSNSVSETSLSGDILRYVRYQLRGRRGLIVGIVALAVAGLWFSWPWLVLAGIAPILIAIAPCAIMCALGLCGRHLVSGASRGEADSSVSGGAASCCSKPQLVDETVISMSASKLADEPAEPMASAAASQVSANSVDEPSEAQPDTTGEAGATINQEKEKVQ